MQSNQLTPFGKRTKKRLKELNRNDKWLLDRLRSKDIYISKERYEAILRGDIHGTQHEIAIGKVLKEEEEIQRLIKVAGIKRGK